jgi:release factor glutamine methyltransferase
MLARLYYPRFISWILELLHRRTQREKIALINGLRIQICPQVFNPIIGRTTSFFMQHMKIQHDKRVLEIGTGTGAIAAAAAKVAKSVTATDVSPFAVQCAQTTMQLNQIDNRVIVLQGDLFQPVQDETFDVLLFNPPYFQFTPQSWIAKAWSAGSDYELIGRFLRGAHQVLTRKGEIQILLSSAASGFTMSLIKKGRLFGPLERIYLIRLS